MDMHKDIPNLRFAEFDGILDVKPLIELSVNGFSNGAFNDPKKVGSGYRIINVKDMYVDGTIDVDNLTRVALEEKEFLKNRVEYGDLFFTRSSLVKEGIAYSNVNLNHVDDLTFDGHLIRMRPNQAKTSPIFLYYCFSTSGARKQFIKKGKTTTMTTIGQEDIALVEIKLPTLSEQTKIADFLTSVDDKITQLKKKKSLLEQYKKGVMQKLFSQELRFKDENGNEFADWEEMKLGEVAEIKRGASPRPITDSKWFSDDSKVGWVRISDVTKSNKLLDKTEQYLSKEGIDKSRLVLKGNIIMSICATIGKPIYTNFDVCIHDGFVVFENLKLNKEYLFYYLDMIKLSWYKYGQPGTQVNLNSDIVSNEVIPFPCFPEQTKIANFLSAIDANINHCGMQIEKMEGWKKGLLQRMFV